MNWTHTKSARGAVAGIAALALFDFSGGAFATEPCGDFGACKALVEINSTDGDIGFHFLKDGDDLRATHVEDPSGRKIFEDRAKGSLNKQRYTEVFVESAKPLCWNAPDAEPDDEIVTLEEFVELWEPGTYRFFGMSDAGESGVGETELTFNLPAAPASVDFDSGSGEITWAPGDDLGNCASHAELDALVAAGTLPMHPESVAVSVWEVVFEPDDGSSLKFTVRVPSDVFSVVVPAGYLASIPDNTLGKAEVGAIGEDDNATFTEIGDICINESGGGCEE